GHDDGRDQRRELAQHDGDQDFSQEVAVRRRHHQARLNDERRADQEPDGAHQADGLDAGKQDLTEGDGAYDAARPRPGSSHRRDGEPERPEERGGRARRSDRRTADAAEEPEPPSVLGARIVRKRRAGRAQRVLARRHPSFPERPPARSAYLRSACRRSRASARPSVWTARSYICIAFVDSPSASWISPSFKNTWLFEIGAALSSRCNKSARYICCAFL